MADGYQSSSTPAFYQRSQSLMMSGREQHHKNPARLVSVQEQQPNPFAEWTAAGPSVPNRRNIFRRKVYNVFVMGVI